MSDCAFERGVRIHPHCKRHFFPSQTLPLDYKEAEVIIRANRNFWNQQGALSDDEQHVLDQLEQRLDIEIKRMKRKAFIKLAGRSPKDVALFWSNDNTRTSLRARLRRVRHPDENTTFRIFLEAINDALCIQSGRQAIKYLTLSPRIAKSLTKELRECIRISNAHTSNLDPNKQNTHEEEREAVGERKQPAETLLQLVIREHVGLLPENEFRGFVYNHKLVAISTLQDEGVQRKIQRMLVSFYESIANMVYEANYIIDFAIVGAFKSVNIIAIAPWSENNSACLFDWKEDSALLLGKRGLDFRVRTEPLRAPLSVHVAIPSRQWREFIEQEIRKNRRNFIVWQTPFFSLRAHDVAFTGVALVIGVFVWDYFSRDTQRYLR